MRKQRHSVVDCRAGDGKHDLAEEYLAKTTVTQGYFDFLVGRAQAPVWDVSANHHIERKKLHPFLRSPLEHFPVRLKSAPDASVQVTDFRPPTAANA